MFKLLSTFTRSLSSTVQKAGPIQKAIEEKIKSRFGQYDIRHLEVNNISWQHNVPRGSETHFSVTVVSNKFEGMKLVDRHRVLNEALDDEIKNKNVSFTYRTLNPTRWYNSIQRGLKLDEIYQTPPCLGGRIRELVKEDTQQGGKAKEERSKTKEESLNN